MRVGILTPALILGDAISHDVMGMYTSLKKKGIDAYLFADHARMPNTKAYPCRHADLFLTEPHDVLIYHHGIYFERALDLLLKLNCRKVVKYHNITPPEFYENYPVIRQACIQGLTMNKKMLEIKECVFWAASEFNGIELRKLKPISFSVLYPFNQIEQFAEIAPDNFIIPRNREKALHISIIGRVVPNKNIEAGLRIFAEYQRKYDRAARLMIVGSCDLAAYYRSLQSLGKELGIRKQVTFTGKIPQNKLKAIYMHSDLLLIPSKHEGYCVSMVEAMALGLPVLANRATALPYTGGDAIAYMNEADHEGAANTINRIVSDKAYRNTLSDAGKARYQSHFTHAFIESEFHRLFQSIL